MSKERNQASPWRRTLFRFLSCLLLLPALVLGDIKQEVYPKYPIYLHAQTRKEISFSHGLPPRTNSGSIPLRDEVTHEKQEVHLEKGLIAKQDEHVTWDSSTAQAASAQLKHIERIAIPERKGRRLELSTTSNKLKFAASNLYDKNAHEYGIYAARKLSNPNRCTEPGEIDISPEITASSRRDHVKTYMECIKMTYFGSNPLPSQIFSNPDVSNGKEIQLESIQDFTDELQKFKT